LATPDYRTGAYLKAVLPHPAKIHSIALLRKLASHTKFPRMVTSRCYKNGKKNGTIL